MVRILDSSEFSTWNEFVRGNSFPESFVQTSLWPAERFFIVGETATSRTDATLTQTKANETIIAGCKVEERGLWMGKKVWLVRRIPADSRKSTRFDSRLDSVDPRRTARREVESRKSMEALVEFLIEKAKEQGNVVMIRVQVQTNADVYADQRGLNFTKPRFLLHIKDPKTTLLVDLKYSEEELLREMHEKTRYNIHLAERKGVVVREGNLEEFYRLYEGTNKRKGLKGFSREYFEKLLLARHSKLDLGSRNKKLKQTELSSRAEVSEAWPASPKLQRGERSYLDVRNEIARPPARQASQSLAMTNGSSEVSVKIFTAYHQNIPLASNLLVCFGKTVTYLFGGSSDQYRELMAPHLLHWECMKWAKREGYEWYDWWGIESQSTVNPLRLSEASSKQSTKKWGLRDWEGITRFKSSFVSEKTGKVVDFGETQDLVVDKKWYRIFALVKKML